MELGQLIKKLKNLDQHRVLAIGFTCAHSYRGYYDRLAFEPMESTSIGSMLTLAESAMGQTFCGYKGGEYLMTQFSEVHLARYGCCGPELNDLVLAYMLGEPLTVELIENAR